MTLVEAIVSLFHASVLMLGVVVLMALRKVMRYQLRDLELRERREFEEAQRRADPHRQRIVDAANDWYDDKKGSKDRLRAVVAQSRGIEPFQLIQREQSAMDADGYPDVFASNKAEE